MRTDRPAGRAMPPVEAFEEPKVISIDVDPSSPGPDNPGPEYGDIDEAEELMEEEARDHAAHEGAASPPYIAPGTSNTRETHQLEDATMKKPQNPSRWS